MTAVDPRLEQPPHARTREGEPDKLVDVRVRALLEQYAALSAAELRQRGPDCLELAVPGDDRPYFGGRSVVRVALSHHVLEADPDAEIAIPGSILLEQVIAAVRRRGFRLSQGDVAACIPEDAQAAALTVPVVNGSATSPRTETALHPAGKLVARVTIRAGSSVEEHLIESGLFDLATGLPLGDDVAAACTAHLTAKQSGATGPRSAKDIERLLGRPISELVKLMLADLERRLAPEIGRQRKEAEHELEVELRRIDGYYRTLLSDAGGKGTDIPDAAARRVIDAEHARRRDEETRRHEVRAVAHPVQLVECTIPMQRVEWPVTSHDNHSALVTGQRALVGSGTWTIGCEHCGTLAPTSLVVCRHDHAACAACAHLCTVCTTGFCTDHGLAACHVDGQPACDIHARTCSSCRRGHCTSHELVCDDGGHPACATCVVACAHCARPICDAHAVHTNTHAPLGVRRLCGQCVRYCEGGTNEPVGVDEAVQCASCGRSVCRNHQARCALDGKVHCSKHLRRTDRSRRLVCERDRAICKHEPDAILAADEVVSCASCGAMACETHAAVCVEDGLRFCTEHLVALRDRNGFMACAQHHSVCSVDGHAFSLGGTRECPICGKRACATHTIACSSCARKACSRDVVTGVSSTCVTCRHLTEIADPPDDVLRAWISAQGESGASARRWRMSRDGSHHVVEVDTGWTRRVVFTVRHGDSKADTVVRHSILGSTVVRR